MLHAHGISFKYFNMLWDMPKEKKMPLLIKKMKLKHFSYYTTALSWNDASLCSRYVASSIYNILTDGEGEGLGVAWGRVWCVF